MPLSHAPLAQSVSAAHRAPALHAGHEPPQSTSLS